MTCEKCGVANSIEASDLTFQSFCSTCFVDLLTKWYDTLSPNEILSKFAPIDYLNITRETVNGTVEE